MGNHCLWLVLVVPSARAADEHQSDAREVAASFVKLLGGKIDRRHQKAGIDLVEVTIDQDTIEKEIPFLQKLGVLNYEMSSTFARMHPISLSAVVGTQAVIMVIITNYKADKDLDKAIFDVGVTVSDDYGHQGRKKMFSFSFDRPLYSRINWDRFDNTKLPKVAKGFKYSDWMIRNIGN